MRLPIWLRRALEPKIYTASDMRRVQRSHDAVKELLRRRATRAEAEVKRLRTLMHGEAERLRALARDLPLDAPSRPKDQPQEGEDR